MVITGKRIKARSCYQGHGQKPNFSWMEALKQHLWPVEPFLPLFGLSGLQLQYSLSSDMKPKLHGGKSILIKAKSFN